MAPRHVWKERAAKAGLKVAFGGPLPAGRRIVVTVSGGRVIADRDETARWRGRLLVAEEPADVTPAARARIRAAALEFAPDGDSTLELAWDGDDDSESEPVLIGAMAGMATEPPSVAGTVRLTTSLTTVHAYAGPLTELHLPPEASTDLVIGQPLALAAGTVLVRLVIIAADRRVALDRLAAALAECRLGGPLTDRDRLVQAVPLLAAGLTDARDLDVLPATACAVEVIHPGLLTTVQDVPGRLGHWDVGVPPSGPFDDFAFRLANRLVGNPETAAGLEFTLVGPTLRFLQSAIICLTGAPRQARLDGQPLPLWTAVAVPAGGVVVCGVPDGAGCRGYLAIRHGLAVPTYLGSRATFDLGGFGGHAGRGLRIGDHVPLTRAAGTDELAECPRPLAVSARPPITRRWVIGVLEGPHAAPEFLTPADMAVLYAHPYQVHHNSNRTGIRLIGPKPTFARPDGGEAGLHPSNIHDNAYAIGAIDFTGDMPILLGPDGPSCGGFVCPAVVVAAERWKLGQLRPGDVVRFARLTPAAAEARLSEQQRLLRELTPRTPTKAALAADSTLVAGDPGNAIVLRHGDWCLRRGGDEYLLVEVGEPVLDLGLRLRIHLLWQRLHARREPGIIDLTPGIRSLQIHVDPKRLSVAQAAVLVRSLVDALGSIDDVVVPRRTVWLPLSWDDPAARQAIGIYTRSVNPTAPWCPSNIEFIRRINGLATIDEVQRIVFEAEYLVMGLGDVYLGAPVATPLDPRHRLVTTKYNPARTWTAQNSVGIGGAYMCIYGMEGPGGYQLIGRTVPIWDTWSPLRPAPSGQEPWLLRFFDVVRFFPVSHDELTRLRAAPYQPRIEPGVFAWRTYRDFLAEQAAGIAAFRSQQRAAFAAERARWEVSG